MRTAPAFVSRVTTVASMSITRSRYAPVPHVVGPPRAATMSLTPQGRPCNSPRVPASRALAIEIARLSERPLAEQGDDAVEPGVEALEPRERQLGKLDRADKTTAHEVREIDQRPEQDVVEHGGPRESCACRARTKNRNRRCDGEARDARREMHGGWRVVRGRVGVQLVYPSDDAVERGDQRARVCLSERHARERGRFADHRLRHAPGWSLLDAGPQHAGEERGRHPRGRATLQELAACVRGRESGWHADLSLAAWSHDRPVVAGCPTAPEQAVDVLRLRP